MHIMGSFFDNLGDFAHLPSNIEKKQIDSIIHQFGRFCHDFRVTKNVLGFVVFESDHNLLQKSFCKKSETNEKHFCSETLLNLWSHAEIIKCVIYMPILSDFVKIYEE